MADVRYCPWNSIRWRVSEKEDPQTPERDFQDVPAGDEYWGENTGEQTCVPLDRQP